MLIVTVVSLVAAVTAGLIAWRSIRREHVRADARIALLASTIDASPLRDTHPINDAFDWFGEEAQTRVPVAATFDDPAAPAIRRHPLLTAGIGLAVVLAIVVLIAMTSDRYDTARPAITSPRHESLELLSLRAARDGDSLAITGRVRNRTDEPLNAITAVVSAVDDDGRAVGSASAPLAALSPGRESRFVVTIKEVGDVARYRVSFRGAAGVIRHLDRRAARTSGVS